MAAPQYTPRQGQFLAFIHYYIKLNETGRMMRERQQEQQYDEKVPSERPARAYMGILVVLCLLVGVRGENGALAAAQRTGMDTLVGQPADIAPSAYHYRADRKPEDNQPESWLALMRYANLPLNKPLDLNAPAIKQVLYALLWEEIRPIRQVELTWSTGVKKRPGLEDLTITTLDNQGTASSWWNNLKAAGKSVRATVSADGRTYAYELRADACGAVISVKGAQAAAEYAVPMVRVLVADVWKKMDFEIEWGYEPGNAEKDYSGRIEAYDGVVAGLTPLDGDAVTAVISPAQWRSTGKGGPRRGIKASLLYLGTSKWRKVYPFTSQPDDVARTIVTVRTTSGNFSFLAADLENGPILAPEYGFFVRRTSALAPLPEKAIAKQRTSRIPLAPRMDSIAGRRDSSAGAATTRRGSAAIRATRRSRYRGSQSRPGRWPCIPELRRVWPWVGAAPWAEQ